MLVRCGSCKGSKRVTKMGGLVGDCLNCNGIGHVVRLEEKKPVEAIEIKQPDPVSVESINKSKK